MTVSDYINPLVLRYALWGTKVTQRWGIGCTDWLIGDIPKIWELWEWHRKLYILRVPDYRLIGYIAGIPGLPERQYMYSLPANSPWIVTVA